MTKQTPSFVDSEYCINRSANSLSISGREPTGFPLRTEGTRRGEVIRLVCRLSGEFRIYGRLAGLGNPKAFAPERVDVFFLIKRGSIVECAAELPAASVFGVASAWLEGKNDCRLLRGILVGVCILEVPSASSSSKEERLCADFLGLGVLGNGDGLRGPSGR